MGDLIPFDEARRRLEKPAPPRRRESLTDRAKRIIDRNEALRSHYGGDDEGPEAA